MKNWDKLTRQEIKDLQSKKLHEFINHQLYPFSPFYKKLFDDHKINPQKIKSVDDLKHIPFISKKDLLPTPDNPSKFRDFILQPDEHKIKKSWPLKKLLPLAANKILKGEHFVKEKLGHEYRPIFLTATTGRTAAPITFFYSAYDLERLKIAGHRLAEVFDVKHEDRGINMFPYAPHLAFWQVAFGGFSYGALIISTGGGKVLGTKANIAVVTKIKPQMIIGVPGYIYHLLRTACEEKEDFSSVEKIVLGAEKVPPGLKEKMAELLMKMAAKEPRIIGTYGFTEARTAWGECPTKIGISSGYHTYPDMEIFEIINPKTGEAVGEGEEGEIVYSNLNSRASCVLRFRTGDLVKGGMVWEPCPYCQRTIPRISSDITRVSNIAEIQLTKIKGTLVNLNTFSEILAAAHEIEEWQIEIRKKNNDPLELDELVVYVAFKPTVNEEEVKRKLRENFLIETEIAPNEINTLPIDEILRKLGMETEMKEKRIVDLRPKYV